MMIDPDRLRSITAMIRPLMHLGPYIVNLEPSLLGLWFVIRHLKSPES